MKRVFAYVRPRISILARRTVVAALVLGPFILGAQSEEKNANSQRTYINRALGFSYIYPIQLIPNTSDFRRSLRSSQQRDAQGVVLFSAFEATNPGKARDGVVVTSEDVAHYGTTWDAEHCLRKVTMILSRQDWTVLRQGAPATFDGQNFLRSDYKHTNPLVFQSVVCTIWKESALEFVLSAGSEEEINQLFRSLETLHFWRSLREPAPQ